MLAPHYARALVRGCGSRAAFIRATDGEASPIVSELLPGEDFAVLEYAGGWAWGYSVADHVVGYVEAIALADRIEPTHFVCEKSAPVMAADDITAPLLASLPMGALLRGEEDGASLASEYGRVSLAHLRRIDEREADPVVVAERLFGAPYLPGGRTAGGIDAGGLVQLALFLCGVAVPRFPDLLATAGEAAAGPAQRGDLAVGGDVAGLMIDDRMMIHASAAAGKVAVEPLPPGTTLRRLTP